MKLKNSTYDFLKWFALVAIPAIEAFWLTIGKVWGFPYLTEIGTTIAAVGLLIAALIGVSTSNYRADKEQDTFADDDDIYDEDAEDEDDEEEDNETEE